MKDRFMRNLLLLGVAILTGHAMPASATPIGPSATGLTAPLKTMTFSEVAILDGTAVTNQFAPYGVTFAGLYYNPQQVTINPTIVPPELGNFQSLAFPTPIRTFNIYFTNPVSAAVLAMYANRDSGGTTGPQGISTFTASLGGVVQETFDAKNSQNKTDFYGFTNITFDQITVDVGGFRSAALIDNLQFNPIPAPEPATALLVSVGLLGIGCCRRHPPSKTLS
jgi:hypothetical protein